MNQMTLNQRSLPFQHINISTCPALSDFSLMVCFILMVNTGFLFSLVAFCRNKCSFITIFSFRQYFLGMPNFPALQM